jgi:hypothetical protein
MWRVPLNLMAVAMSGLKDYSRRMPRMGARVLETEFRWRNAK